MISAVFFFYPMTIRTNHYKKNAAGKPTAFFFIINTLSALCKQYEEFREPYVSWVRRNIQHK